MNYFFRDKEINLLGDISYHPAGYVEHFNYFSSEPNRSGKDMSVCFVDPFTGEVINAWRSNDEVELFEVSDGEYFETVERYRKIAELW